MDTIYLVVAAVVGILIGFGAAAAYGQTSQEKGNFCKEVENGLQQNMSQGFVNCFSPEQVSFRLRESISNKTSATCICRSKIGDTVRQINIAQPE